MLVPPFTRSPLRHRQARDAKPLPPVFLVAGRGNDVAENLRGTLEGADPTRWSFRSRRWDNLGDRLAKAGDESGLPGFPHSPGTTGKKYTPSRELPWLSY